MKVILHKVSFNRSLFRKEYRKSLSWLSDNERTELRSWVRAQRLLPVGKPVSENL